MKHVDRAVARPTVDQDVLDVGMGLASYAVQTLLERRDSIEDGGDDRDQRKDEYQVGQATSGTWSPLLKKNIALVHVPSRYSATGTRIKVEQTVEYRRHKVTARVVPRPFFDPDRKRA